MQTFRRTSTCICEVLHGHSAGNEAAFAFRTDLPGTIGWVSSRITESIGNPGSFKGPCIEESTDANGVTSRTETWNDCVSSVRLAPGWRATLYRDGSYDGDRLDVTGDIANLQLSRGDCDHDGFNDCATSIRVFRN